MKQAQIEEARTELYSVVSMNVYLCIHSNFKFSNQPIMIYYFVPSILTMVILQVKHMICIQNWTVLLMIFNLLLTIKKIKTMKVVYIH